MSVLAPNASEVSTEKAHSGTASGTATERVASARPPKLGRLLTLDLMRGYFVLILASVHLDYGPSLLGYLDGRGRLWVSEAEGFFFISGLLVAMLRRRDLENSGFRQAARRSWARGGKLYLVACVCTIAYTGLGRIVTNFGWTGAKPGLDTESSWQRVLYNTLSLHYVYGWTDFLTFYAPLFFIAPLLIWLMSHRLTWLVVLVSVAAYVSMSFDSAIWGASGAFIQWQVHFVVGAAVGYHLTEIFGWLRSLRHRTRQVLALVAVTSAVLLYGAGMVTLWAPSLRPTAAWYDFLIFDNRLGLLRPVFLLIMFAGGYVVIERLHRPIMATVGNVVTLFGRNSMYVYIVQSALVFAIPFISAARGVVFNSLLDFAVIGLVWLGLHKQFLFRLIPR
ncbi:OpgC domain-containing protein [Jatrophihabitans sp. DSM 45814]